MDCKFNMQDMVPFVALAKLQATVDMESASPEEILKRFSEMVWEFEAAYTDVTEHEGFKWGDKD